MEDTNRISERVSSTIYNVIRGQVNRVLGVGDGASLGYGRSLESVDKGNELIKAEDMVLLYNDLVKARTHQKGSADLQWSNSQGLNPPSSGEVIGYYAADITDIIEADLEPTVFTIEWSIPQIDWNTKDPNNALQPYNTSIQGTGFSIRIIKIGSSYQATIINPGAGYNANDSITIPGTLVGGLSPTNDITVDITEVSSTGQVETITYYGLGKPEQSSRYSINDANEGFQDFILAANDITTDKNLIGTGQTSVSVRAFSNRTRAWNGYIRHSVKVTWANANERRYFFNSGGEIRFDAALSGGLAGISPNYKDSVWQSMLSNVGTVIFNRDSVYNTGIEGTGRNFGNYSGTETVDWADYTETSPIKIFTQPGAGVYSDNEYLINAYQEDDNILVFDIRFEDNDIAEPVPPNTPVDENVTGETQSVVSTKTATGILEIPEPEVEVLRTL